MNLTLVYLIYGLAFFSMGLALLLETRRTPLLAEGRALRLLAGFGLLHGLHEWLEMALQQPQAFGVDGWRLNPQVLLYGRLGLLAFSFALLAGFGLRLLWPAAGARRSGWLVALYLALGLLFGLGLAAAFGLFLSRWAPFVDAWTRYWLAVPGAGLAALALWRRGQATASLNLRRSLWLAAGAFALYALSQLCVPRQDFFPANVLNSAAFLQLTGVPVQVLRAAVAVLATLGLLGAIQAVDVQRQQQFFAAQQARLQALEQVQQELAEREVLRRELLRHTVQAQEDERRRIARELHDETAQMLTAFSLHLATLNANPEPARRSESLAQLQALSRQMADGIYRLVHDLRPAQLDDLGLPAALKHLAEAESRRGLQVSLDVPPMAARLDPLLETVLFRVAQEALANVVRHAGVKQAGVKLQIAPGQVALRITDAGCGFDPQVKLLPPRGWGLAGMRERAESVGGTLQVQSVPGQGTVVELVAPTVGA